MTSLDLTSISYRLLNLTKEIFIEPLINIKAEAEQALARNVACSVIGVPDYLDEITRDAVAAAAADIGLAGSEPVLVMLASEAVRLAYDFGTCSGKHNFRGSGGFISQ